MAIAFYHNKLSTTELQYQYSKETEYSFKKENLSLKNKESDLQNKLDEMTKKNYLIKAYNSNIEENKNERLIEQLNNELLVEQFNLCQEENEKHKLQLQNAKIENERLTNELKTLNKYKELVKKYDNNSQLTEDFLRKSLELAILTARNTLAAIIEEKEKDWIIPCYGLFLYHIEDRKKKLQEYLNNQTRLQKKFALYPKQYIPSQIITDLFNELENMFRFYNQGFSFQEKSGTKKTAEEVEKIKNSIQNMITKTAETIQLLSFAGKDLIINKNVHISPADN